MSLITKAKAVVDISSDRKDWFETWFDSPYYHILYKDRDHREAELFLDALIGHIGIIKGARILDVACGKGRHSIYLNKNEFDVTGFDLSEKSIAYDKQFENNTLHFYLHDMREVFRSNYYDVVLNLFSSFGYFEKERDNFRCLNANTIALKPGGIFVLDYFNANFIRKHGNITLDKNVDGILFHIEKIIDGNYIRKKISFTDKGKQFEFREQLWLADVHLLQEYFKRVGLHTVGCFGNYDLNAFIETESERLILIGKKEK